MCRLWCLLDGKRVGILPSRSLEFRAMVNAGGSTAQTPSPAEPESYEQALAELEKLVSAMEGAQLPLDDLLQSYRRGAQLLAYCRARLQTVEQQVKVLERGQLEAFDGS